MAELAEQFDVHPNQIQDWKKRLVEQAGELFARGPQSDSVSDDTVQALHAKIGQLAMENDFLARGLERTHGPRGKKW
jgi:transposase-like protein